MPLAFHSHYWIGILHRSSSNYEQRQSIVKYQQCLQHITSSHKSVSEVFTDIIIFVPYQFDPILALFCFCLSDKPTPPSLFCLFSFYFSTIEHSHVCKTQNFYCALSYKKTPLMRIKFDVTYKSFLKYFMTLLTAVLIDNPDWTQQLWEGKTHTLCTLWSSQPGVISCWSAWLKELHQALSRDIYMFPFHCLSPLLKGWKKRCIYLSCCALPKCRNSSKGETCWEALQT